MFYKQHCKWKTSLLFKIPSRSLTLLNCCIFSSENRLILLHLRTISNKNIYFSYLCIHKENCTYHCRNVSTTPLRQWGFQQCLPFSWTTLRYKHCRHPEGCFFLSVYCSTGLKWKNRQRINYRIILEKETLDARDLKFVYIRRLMVSTDQADPSCFYFRISWILMERRWFYFFSSPPFSAGPQK